MMIKPNRTLVLISGSFPYPKAAEETFLGPEIAFLSEKFDRVVLLPADATGKPVSVPVGVHVETGLADALKSHSLPNRFKLAVSALGGTGHFFEMFGGAERMFSAAAWRRLVSSLGVAMSSRRWLSLFVEREGLAPDTTVFYTYWLTGVTFGAGLLKRRFPELRVVSRAHGHDVYFERHRPAYIPLRRPTLAAVDAVFFCSRHGCVYTATRFPEYRTRCRVAFLGVPDPGFSASGDESGPLHIVSCSFLVPVKRIDLLVRALSLLGDLAPGRRFVWTHLGGGPLEHEIKTQAGALLPTNVQGRLMGHLPNQAVFKFYRDHPVDLFVNVSRFEGIPVSVMEAQSCGIPVLATAVGGTPEIVDHSNGFLISPDPTPEEIAAEILRISGDRTVLAERAEEAKRTWKRRFNASVNFSRFAAELVGAEGEGEP